MLGKDFGVAVGAAQTGIRIDTDEIPDALEVIADTCLRYGWQLRVWDKTLGLQAKGISSQVAAAPDNLPPGLAALASQAPASLLGELIRFLNEPAAIDPEDPTATLKLILVVKNFHLAFESGREAISSALQHLIERGKAEDKYVVGLMPAEAKLPPEVDPLFHVIGHELPDVAELTEILAGIASDEELASSETFDYPDAPAIVQAALGLTRLQAEGIFAASRVQAEDGQIQAKDVWDHKAKILNRDKLVELLEPALGFSDIGGLQGLKDFLIRITAPDNLEEVDPDALYKGVVCVGAPGVGKSLTAICLGRELNVPTLLLNPGNLMGEYVGVTERNTRKFFQIIKRMSPCVCVIDEINQTMGNGKNSNSAVDNRMLGSFLSALNDIKEPVFWFFTANEIEGMHPAFFRAERVDAKFYVRLPDADQRAVVWRIYVKKFFPKKITGVADPRGVELDVDRALKRFFQADDDRETRLAATLMTLPMADREAALRELAKKKLRAVVEPLLVDDAGWTPAEIRACCRLARRLNLPLHLAARRVGHECLGAAGEKMLAQLDRWAEQNGALDAETGELFVRTKAGDAPARDDDPARTKKVRRKVSKIAE